MRPGGNVQYSVTDTPKRSHIPCVYFSCDLCYPFRSVLAPAYASSFPRQKQFQSLRPTVELFNESDTDYFQYAIPRAADKCGCTFFMQSHLFGFSPIYSSKIFVQPQIYSTSEILDKCATHALMRPSNIYKCTNVYCLAKICCVFSNF